jgi:hypothetical protein
LFASQEGQMSESGSSSLGSNEEIDDPGRDPKGLNPPRNLWGGADQDTGQSEPRGEGNVGPADKPGDPTDEPEARVDTP